MTKKESTNKDSDNERVARILTTEEYEQIKKDREKAEKMQYSSKTRFRASVIELYLLIPIVIGILGVVPVLTLLFDFKLYSLIALIIWVISAYIGFLIAKYIMFDRKELWVLIDKKDNPGKYKEK